MIISIGFISTADAMALEPLGNKLPQGIKLKNTKVKLYYWEKQHFDLIKLNAWFWMSCLTWVVTFSF